MVSLLWFICSPFKFIFGILTLVKALVGGDGKREIFRNEVSPLLKVGPREPASLSQQVRTQLKVVPMKKKSRRSPDPAFIRTAIWTSQSLKLWEKKVCCLEVTQSMSFLIASQVMTETYWVLRKTIPSLTLYTSPPRTSLSPFHMLWFSSVEYPLWEATAARRYSDWLDLLLWDLLIIYKLSFPRWDR